MSQNKKVNNLVAGQDFKTVPYRRRRPRAPPKLNPNTAAELDCTSDDVCPEAIFNKQIAIKQINEAIADVEDSDIFASAFASLREAISLLDKPEVKEIYALGLGHVGERMIPRYQLALLICLKKKFDAKLYAYDPIFHPIEKTILEEFGIKTLDENLEGKYKASLEYATIFYLPHCAKQLTNNLLWANWGLKLKNCIIIANSFRGTVDDTPVSFLKNNGQYLLKIYEHVVELAILNTFKYFDIFNNLSVHIFPPKRLVFIPSDFWHNAEEPEYQPEEIEYISVKNSDTSI